jgi:hypothetical protein
MEIKWIQVHGCGNSINNNSRNIPQCYCSVNTQFDFTKRGVKAAGLINLMTKAERHIYSYA